VTSSRLGASIDASERQGRGFGVGIRRASNMDDPARTGRGIFRRPQVGLAPPCGAWGGAWTREASARKLLLHAGGLGDGCRQAMGRSKAGIQRGRVELLETRRSVLLGRSHHLRNGTRRGCEQPTRTWHRRWTAIRQPRKSSVPSLRREFGGGGTAVGTNSSASPAPFQGFETFLGRTPL